MPPRRRKADRTERARTAELGAPRRGARRRLRAQRTDDGQPPPDRLDEREARVRRRRKAPGPDAEAPEPATSGATPPPPDVPPSEPQGLPPAAGS